MPSKRIRTIIHEAHKRALQGLEYQRDLVRTQSDELARSMRELQAAEASAKELADWLADNPES